MPLDIQDYKTIADEMIEADSARDAKFQRIDDMHNVAWELPPSWKSVDWIKKYPSTKAGDSLDAAIRALSTKEPNISVMPILPNEETKAHFDRIERALKWAYKQMGRRSQFNPTRAIVASAIKYDEITAQLIHTPTHNASLSAMSSKAAKKTPQYGAFALEVHNPRNVHVQYSTNGFERVVLCKRMPIYKIVDFWGTQAKGLYDAVKRDKTLSLTDTVIIYDYMDIDTRAVWVDLSREQTEAILPPTEHKLGFIPWACRIGGTSLDDQPEYQRRPLLNSIVNGDLWNTVNLFRSLMLSLTMARAAEPTIENNSPTRQPAEIDATQAIGQILTGPGERLTKLPPSEVGQSVQGMFQMLGGELDTSAGINLLQMNTAPAGMAFATYNAMLQAAMGSINPHKQTAEMAIADIFGLMIAWHKHTSTSLLYYDDRQKEATYGAQDNIDAEELPNLEDFCATVKLSEYIPSDEMGKINSAVMLTQNLPFPAARALEMLDVADPKLAFEEWGAEQIDRAMVTEKVKDIQAQGDMLRQAQAMKMQAQMQQEMMQQQQAQQAPQGQPGQPMPDEQAGTQPVLPPDPSMQAPFDQAQGQGFAGNMGGSSPLSAAPEMTGVGLPDIEGADFRGLRMPPQGRKPVQ